MSSNDLDYYKVVNQLHNAITQLNSNHKIDVANVYGSSSIDVHSTDNRPTKGYGSRNPYMPEDVNVITIKNPENLNTNNQIISGEWNIEYMGRDLSIEGDNYRWDVYNNRSSVRGYYILERELIEGSWLNVRWGRVPTNVKERKELIDKSRLRDKGMIQRDMIIAVINSK